MPRPNGDDLRSRSIWMVELFGYSVDEVAATLFMSPRTVERYISKCLKTGDRADKGWAVKRARPS